jgi:hypothetical protein
MKMLSPEHCVVELVYQHPQLGALQVDKFQRRLRSCRYNIEQGTILWQGTLLKINSWTEINCNDVPNLNCRAHFIFCVDVE